MPTNIYIPPGADETDLVEEMAISRDAYEKGLQQLVAYYSRSGNNMKLDMAEKELRSFTTMLKYKYLLGPVAGGQATTPFAEADRLFYDAQALEKQGRPSGTRLITDKNKLRLALQKYDQLMRNYPSSDKVDDAAYYAGVILEEFTEYVLALEYYRIYSG
jgi:tetratricopeptide (TPR) repeat protein